MQVYLVAKNLMKSLIVKTIKYLKCDRDEKKYYKALQLTMKLSKLTTKYFKTISFTLKGQIRNVYKINKYYSSILKKEILKLLDDYQLKQQNRIYYYYISQKLTYKDCFTKYLRKINERNQRRCTSTHIGSVLNKSYDCCRCGNW